MASLGLLGALGGLGQGLSQTGKMMYDEETEKSREQRLQAIRDKDYARARKDAVSDMDRKFTEGKRLMELDQNFRDTQRSAGETFTGGQNDKNRKFEKERDALKMTQYVTFEKGKDGRIYGFNSNGDSKAIEGFEGELISFSDLTSLARTSAANLTLMSEADPGYEDAVAFSITLQNALNSKLQTSGLGVADGPTAEFLNTLPKQRGVDGKLYVQHLGKTYAVNE
jgi:hypothetical protein